MKKKKEKRNLSNLIEFRSLSVVLIKSYFMLRGRECVDCPDLSHDMNILGVGGRVNSTGNIEIHSRGG